MRAESEGYISALGLECNVKNISIIGASGSIGTQTLDVLRSEKDINLVGVSVHSNLKVLRSIIEEFGVMNVAVTDPKVRGDAELMLSSIGFKGASYFGAEGLEAIATLDEAQTVVTSIVGMAGLKPTIKAIEKGKHIALANKETMVAAGGIVTQLAKEKGVMILPVDSEHSAIFQSLRAGKHSEIRKILLTASGGPFRGKDREFLSKVTKEMALKHPNWAMGAKITIDSSTLMNKGLEVIEAKWLFDVDYDDIEVYVHPESIIHSMVEFRDNSIIAQLGTPDMTLPIQYALNYPERHEAVAGRLDLFKAGSLTFEKPDRETFEALDMAYEAGRAGGIMTAVLNSANEEAVDLFLRDRIGYLDITRIIGECLRRFDQRVEPTLGNILEADKEVRDYARSVAKG
jgi:1-deoxy-D-xylulose-5-phosphate reductoisomerase